MSSRLASLLVQDGHVPARRMAEAFQRQVIYGGTLDTILLEMGLVDEAVVLDYLVRAAELPAAELPSSPPEDAALWFPPSVAERFSAAPIGRDGERARVMVIDPPSPVRLAELQELLKLELDARVGTEYRLHLWREQVYGTPVPPRFAALAMKVQRHREPPPRERRSTRPMPTVVVREEPAQAADAGGPVQSFVVEELPPQAVPEPVPEERNARHEVAMPVAEAPLSTSAPLQTTDFEARPPALGAVSALPHDEGIKLLHEVTERDTIFETLCRMARDRFAFASVFTVQPTSAAARMALADAWVSHDVLAHVTVPLAQPSSLRAAVVGRAPYLGRVDDDAPMSQAMAMLGRPAELWGALLPVVLRDRTVAVLVVDDEGRVRDAAEVVDLIAAVAAAAQAFQRLILKQKADKLSKAPAPAPVATDDVPTQELRLRASGAPPAEELRKKPRRAPEEQKTDPGFRRALRDPARDEAIARALAAVEAGGPGALAAGETLLGLGDDAARALALRLPGRPALEGPSMLPSLAVRFGDAIVPHLLPRTSDPSSEVRRAAAWVLGELRAPDAVAPLGARLFDGDAGVRRAAAAALARFPPGPELRALVESLRADLPGPDPARQGHAAAALGELRDAPSVPRLVELVKHRDIAVVDAARHALVQITKQDFGTSRWRWRSWWERNRGLSRLAWMLAGLDHSLPQVRASASEELEALGSDRFGFHRELPAGERDAARQRWAAWYKQHAPAREERTTR